MTYNFPYTDQSTQELIDQKKYTGEGVMAILINNKNQILMMLRDDKPDIVFPNHWSIFGGAVEEGEDLITALKREIKEELDFDLQEVKPFAQVIDFKGRIFLISVFISRIDVEIEDLTLLEGQDFRFFSREECLSLKIPEDLIPVIYNKAVWNFR